jgi:hypothetical protein
VWVKSRSQAVNHVLFDSVRGFGSNKELSSDNSNAEGGTSSGTYGYVSGTASDSFTVTAGTSGANYVNVSSQNYVAWCWKAGNGTSSNTDGSITSTVSANPTAGFSVVTYTGNGSASARVGHGLGAVPSMVIVKSRDALGEWHVAHTSLGIKNIFLNLNNAQLDPAADSSLGGLSILNSSTTFGFVSGNSSADNVVKNGDDYVAYCFAEIEGYSKFGQYVANGNFSSGPFIYTGFKPSFVLIKVFTAAGNWQLYDNKRGTYNDNGPVLYPDLTQYEDDLTNSLDFLSNGFKLYGYGNDSPQSFLYCAFAENPFGGSGVSPATAR